MDIGIPHVFPYESRGDNLIAMVFVYLFDSFPVRNMANTICEGVIGYIYMDFADWYIHIPPPF
jgi:hypothetical protein